MFHQGKNLLNSFHSSHSLGDLTAPISKCQRRNCFHSRAPDNHKSKQWSDISYQIHSTKVLYKANYGPNKCTSWMINWWNATTLGLICSRPRFSHKTNLSHSDCNADWVVGRASGTLLSILAHAGLDARVGRGTICNWPFSKVFWVDWKTWWIDMGTKMCMNIMQLMTCMLRDNSCVSHLC